MAPAVSFCPILNTIVEVQQQRDHLHPEEEAEVPGRHVVHPVEHVVGVVVARVDGGRRAPGGKEEDVVIELVK